MAELNKNELECMRILWGLGPSKPAEIEAAFGWPIENATLRSALRQLVEKGQSKRRKVGKAFVYRAAAGRGRTLSKMSRRMAQVFTGGSTAGLIMELLKSESLSPEEIAELRRIAEERATAPERGAGE